MRTFARLLLAILLVAPTAIAADPSAAQLFNEGVTLFKKGDVDAACTRFEASYGLAEEPGTLFNLAACHEKQGHYFEAHVEFSTLAARMQAAGKADKAKIATRRAEQAGKHAPKLELVFPASSNVAGIELDGKQLPAGDWKQPIFVAPGTHQLVFSAANKKAASASATAANDKSARVQVPILEDEPQLAPAPLPANTPTQTAPANAKPTGEHASTSTRKHASTSATEHAPPPVPDAPVRAQGFWTTERTFGAVFMGVGVVGLGVGGVYGLRALSEKSDADDACGNSSGACPTAAHTNDAKAHIESAQTAATISTIGFAAGAVSLGAGAYLFFAGGKPVEAPVARRTVRVLPAGPGDAGISVAGVF